MNEQGGYIVSIKTTERIDFDRLSSRYNFDLFQHSVTFDEEKKQFIVDALVNLEQIGQLVHDGYIVEVKAYHIAEGLPASQIVNITEWLKEEDEKEKAETEKAKKGKAKKGKAKKGKRNTPRQRAQSYEGGHTLPVRRYLDYDGVWTTLTTIRNRHPDLCELLSTERTSEGRVIPLLRILGGRIVPGKPGVLLIGGLHARELVNTDILVSFAFDLLTAYYWGYDLTYGNTRFPHQTIKRFLDRVEIYILPLANPDGRVHAMNTADMWRMNRNPNGGNTCSNPACPIVDGKGVDCNRNFDFLWNSGIMTSPDPCGCLQIYKGASAFSEPESRNIRQILDLHRNINRLLDLHSYAEKVLYPWQIDENQTTNSAMNFLNPAYDGQRGRMGDAYREYIPPDDLAKYRLLAGRVADSINRVRNGQYGAGQGATYIYPASATSMDYAYSRYFVDSRRAKVSAMSIETTKWFNPVNPERPPPPSADPKEKLFITKEISAGLIAFLHFIW